MSVITAESLTVQRTFSLSIDLGEPCEAVAQQVLDAMSPTEVRIFRSDSKSAHSDYRLKRFPVADGGPLDSGRVVGKDYLPLVCQHIRWGAISAFAQPTEYSHNIPEALLEPRDDSSSGVENLYGEIRLNRAYRAFLEEESLQDVLCFLIAHGILHALCCLPIVLPAFLDWEAYRESFRNGTNSVPETEMCLRLPHYVFSPEWREHSKTSLDKETLIGDIEESNEGRSVWLSSSLGEEARQIELLWPVERAQRWLRAAGEFNPQWLSSYGRREPCC